MYVDVSTCVPSQLKICNIELLTTKMLLINCIISVYYKTFMVKLMKCLNYVHKKNVSFDQNGQNYMQNMWINQYLQLIGRKQTFVKIFKLFCFTEDKFNSFTDTLHLV